MLTELSLQDFLVIFSRNCGICLFILTIPPLYQSNGLNLPYGLGGGLKIKEMK